MIGIELSFDDKKYDHEFMLLLVMNLLIGNILVEKPQDRRHIQIEKQKEGIKLLNKCITIRQEYLKDSIVMARSVNALGSCYFRYVLSVGLSVYYLEFICLTEDSVRLQTVLHLIIQLGLSLAPPKKNKIYIIIKKYK